MNQSKADCVIASNNLGKWREFQQLLAPMHFNLIYQGDLSIPPAQETACTFVENALLKARHACEETGHMAIADDSGLVVDALNGAPGVHSARYAGDQRDSAANIKKLLADMESLAADDRRASFVCVLVYLRHAYDPLPIICQGIWQGQIHCQAQGKQGFGYDPIFFLPDYHCTAAQLDAERKNQISHRAKAMIQMKKALVAR